MMLSLRIRKAEVALADGRLEEAYQQAITDDVRNHRKGQKLVGRLTRAYEKRARVHLKAGNHTAALSDADRALRLGGNQPEIVALRANARAELDVHEGAKQARQQKIVAAKRCLASGDYSGGEQLCKQVDEGKTVLGLMQDAELNRRTIDAIVDRGRKALKASQWESLLDALEEALRLQPTHQNVIELRLAATQSLAKHVRATVSKGRLDQADLLLGRLRRSMPDSLDVQEMSRVVSQCREISASVKRLEMSSMVAGLKSLKQVIPEARWLQDAIKDAEAAARSTENIRTGPLGAMFPSAGGDVTIARQPTVRSADPVHVFDATESIPQRFLIHLDGAGSFLVIRDDAVKIGAAGRSQNVDIPLQSQIGSTVLTVERMDDDYFLTTDMPVPVNGKLTTSKLLTSNDQVRLGRRGSMHFSQPNAASTSAILDFAGIRLAAGNARRAILMDDSIVIGPQSSAHIQSLAMDRAMILHWRDGGLRIRPMSRHTEDASAELALDRPHDVDGLSLVVTKASGVV